MADTNKQGRHAPAGAPRGGEPAAEPGRTAALLTIGIAALGLLIGIGAFLLVTNRSVVLLATAVLMLLAAGALLAAVRLRRGRVSSWAWLIVALAMLVLPIVISDVLGIFVMILTVTLGLVRVAGCDAATPRQRLACGPTENAPGSCDTWSPDGRPAHHGFAAFLFFSRTAAIVGRK